MADYSARFHEKFRLKKSIIFVKFKKKKVLCVHMNFPSSPKKLYVPHMTFLEFQLLFQSPFLVRIFLSKSETAYFSAIFIKKITKLEKQSVICTHNFSWLAKKVVCITYMYVVLRFFSSPAKNENVHTTILH